jgi:hypothetical protein
MTAPSPEFVALNGLVRGYQRSQALVVAAELGIADLLRDGPRDAGDLAAATSTHPPSLYRLLRALASIEVFHEDDEHRFALTPMSEYLRRDHPQSVDPVVRMYCSDYHWRVWGQLGHGVRTGESAAVHALGMSTWEYFRQHPADGEVFDAAMRSLSRGNIAGVLAAHDFSRYGVIADIAGGTGALLAGLLAAHPTARGVLFDQPQVVADAGPVLNAAGVDDRVTLVAGTSSPPSPRAPTRTSCRGSCTTGLTTTPSGSCVPSGPRRSPRRGCSSSTPWSGRRTRTLW